MKERLDVLLVRQGLAASREKAKAIIMSGNVLVNGQREDKAGTMIDAKAEITVEGGQHTEEQRDGDGDEQADEGELQGDGEGLRDHLADRHAGERFTKVETHQTG